MNKQWNRILEYDKDRVSISTLDLMFRDLVEASKKQSYDVSTWTKPAKPVDVVGIVDLEYETSLFRAMIKNGLITVTYKMLVRNRDLIDLYEGNDWSRGHSHQIISKKRWSLTRRIWIKPSTTKDQINQYVRNGVINLNIHKRDVRLYVIRMLHQKSVYEAIHILVWHAMDTKFLQKNVIEYLNDNNIHLSLDRMSIWNRLSSKDEHLLNNIGKLSYTYGTRLIVETLISQYPDSHMLQKLYTATHKGQLTKGVN